jgi:AmmeMemoRadiSam system protein A
MTFTISPQEKRILLDQARESILSKFEKRQCMNPEEGELQGVLREPCGAFVTLHKNGDLRGCIGRMSANSALLETVREMAREAAFGDPRFPPLRPDELEKCVIEISVLSPMSPCSDPKQVKVGVHGLLLRRGGRSGVLLPQVPVEQGWNLQEYLDYICVKAGLPPKSYEAHDAQLFTFTAIVFNEERA